MAKGPRRSGEGSIISESGPIGKPLENEYANERNDLYAGQTPCNGDGLTVNQLVNRFLTSKQRLADSGEMQPRTSQNFYNNCERIQNVFRRNTHVQSLLPIAFENLRNDYTKTHGATTHCGDIAFAWMLFAYCDGTFDNRTKFGQNFRKPSRVVLRKLRQQPVPR
jgi:hypothetical protein